MVKPVSVEMSLANISILFYNIFTILFIYICNCIKNVLNLHNVRLNCDENRSV